MAKSPTKSALTEKLLKLASKNSKRPVSILSESGFISKEVLATLPVPGLNLAHSGRFDGGISYGSHQILGESKTFKTLFGIIQVAAYQEAYPDATAVFLDSEGGANENYWKSCGVDMSRVVHLMVTSVEDYSNLVIPLLSEIAPDDHVIFFTDSVGQMGSIKELANTMEGEAGKQDFTRAKSLNSFWRLAVPLINLSKTPFIWIGSHYDTIDKYNPVALSGGKKGELGSDSIWFISKAKQKDKVDNKEVQTGWVFNIKILKGRFVKEGTVVPICVRYEGGIDKYHGILEFGRLVGAIDMPRSGWYCRSEVLGYIDDKQYAKSQLTPEWYESILANKDFQDMIGEKFQLTSESIMSSASVSYEDVE